MSKKKVIGPKGSPKKDGVDIVWSHLLGGMRKVVVGKTPKGMYFIRAPFPSFTSKWRVTRRITLRSLGAPEVEKVAIELAKDLVSDLESPEVSDEDLIAKWTSVRSPSKDFIAHQLPLSELPPYPGVVMAVRRHSREVLYVDESKNIRLAVTGTRGSVFKKLLSEAVAHSIEYRIIMDARERKFIFCQEVADNRPPYQFRGSR